MFLYLYRRHTFPIKDRSYILGFILCCVCIYVIVITYFSMFMSSKYFAFLAVENIMFGQVKFIYIHTKISLQIELILNLILIL
jgi:hypothetical protein